MGKLNSKLYLVQAEVTKLAASNEDLAQRLESAQQRLELAISRSQHASAQPRPAPAAQVMQLVSVHWTGSSM